MIKGGILCVFCDLKQKRFTKTISPKCVFFLLIFCVFEIDSALIFLGGKKPAALISLREKNRLCRNRDLKKTFYDAVVDKNGRFWVIFLIH